LACSAVGHFFDDAWCTEINVTWMRATCGAFVGYGERGAFGAGWDGEEKAVVGSSVTGVGGQGGAQVEARTVV
jgi:hypothetical protein